MLKSLNDITAAELEEINKLAALFFTPRELAVMMEVNVQEFITATDDPASKIYQAFQGGRLQGEVDLRTGIFKMAKAGSSPAQTMALDILKQSKSRILDR